MTESWLAQPAEPLAAEPAAIAYPPIAEHGIIGDLHSAALVATDGTIDWYCPDRFDSPSVFGRLLDYERGGFFRIAPSEPSTGTKQLYLPDTNVLVTRFLSSQGVSEVQDFMPIDQGPQRLVRRVVGVRGRLGFRVEVAPRFEYGTTAPSVSCEPGRVIFRSGTQALTLASPVPMTQVSDSVEAEFVVEAGESRTFVLHTSDVGPPLSEQDAEALIESSWV